MKVYVQRVQEFQILAMTSIDDAYFLAEMLLYDYVTIHGEVLKGACGWVAEFYKNGDMQLEVKRGDVVVISEGKVVEITDVVSIRYKYEAK